MRGKNILEYRRSAIKQEGDAAGAITPHGTTLYTDRHNKSITQSYRQEKENVHNVATRACIYTWHVLTKFGR